ncbi:unnamed protein product [Sphagnum jensenii]
MDLRLLPDELNKSCKELEVLVDMDEVALAAVALVDLDDHMHWYKQQSHRSDHSYEERIGVIDRVCINTEFNSIEIEF